MVPFTPLSCLQPLLTRTFVRMPWIFWMWLMMNDEVGNMKLKLGSSASIKVVYYFFQLFYRFVPLEQYIINIYYCLQYDKNFQPTFNQATETLFSIKNWIPIATTLLEFVYFFCWKKRYIIELYVGMVKIDSTQNRSILLLRFI